jgi:hypothetical protein
MDGPLLFCEKPPMTCIIYGPTGSYYRTGIISQIIDEDNPKKLENLLQKYPYIDKEKVGRYLEKAIYYHKYKIIPSLVTLRTDDTLLSLLDNCIAKPDLVAMELILLTMNSPILYYRVISNLSDNDENIKILRKILAYPYFNRENKELLLKQLVVGLRDEWVAHFFNIIKILLEYPIAFPSDLGSHLADIEIIQYLIDQKLPVRRIYLDNVSTVIPLRYISRKIWPRLMIQLSNSKVYRRYFKLDIDTVFIYPVNKLSYAIAYINSLLIPAHAPGSKEWKETKDHFELLNGKLSENDNKRAYPELILRANYKVSKTKNLIQKIPCLSKSDLLGIINT